MFAFDTLAFYYMFLRVPACEDKPLSVAERGKLAELVKSNSPLPLSQLDGKYLLKNSESVLESIMKTLLEVCPDPLTMLRLWKQRVTTSEPTAIMAPTKAKGAEEPSYDRTTPYNPLGAALYFTFLYLGHLNGVARFPLLLTNDYLFELFVPAIKSLFEFPVSPRYGVELLQHFCKVLAKSEGLNPRSVGYIDNVVGLIHALVLSIGGQGNGTVRYLSYLQLPKALRLFNLQVFKNHKYDIDTLYYIRQTGSDDRSRRSQRTDNRQHKRRASASKLSGEHKAGGSEQIKADNSEADR
jgi:hypothetical protein